MLSTAGMVIDTSSHVTVEAGERAFVANFLLSGGLPGSQFLQAQARLRPARLGYNYFRVSELDNTEE